MVLMTMIILPSARSMLRVQRESCKMDSMGWFRSLADFVLAYQTHTPESKGVNASIRQCW
ncbi:hypothetical protein BDN70DRAFT_886876 [Pholiota conissans]|uniref:Uncharacterized protein n=1 Tax=Pholiota conissans TaxID=109636 RepID=A0A9P5YPB6_9AGAR|nr:hypothetical protein BDN70DRAFT_886876 [Pholiota conissans]